MSADLLLYTLTRCGIEVTSEIICRQHYERVPSMQTLSTREIGAGYKQSAEPYTEGDRPCETCRQEQERGKGTAA